MPLRAQAMSYEQAGQPHHHVRLRLLQPEGGSASLPALLQLREAGPHATAAAAALAAIAGHAATGKHAGVTNAPPKQCGDGSRSSSHEQSDGGKSSEGEEEEEEQQGRLSSLASDDVPAAEEHADPQ
jgi:hypothetical protein